MNNRAVLTKKGKEELEQRLEHLIKVDRPKNIEDIAFARSQGDLSENAEYDAAKKEEALIANEINEIESTLKNAQIIEENNSSDTVTTGSKITVRYITEAGQGGFHMPEKLSIVGSTEAGVVEDGYYKISNDSPIGRALLSQKVKAGQRIIYDTPKGKRQLQVVSID